MVAEYLRGFTKEPVTLGISGFVKVSHAWFMILLDLCGFSTSRSLEVMYVDNLMVFN